MVAAHDELFCKLAIQNGALAKETAIEALKRFRSDPRRKEGIAKFAVEEGYLDDQTAGKIEHAIEMRAAGGHVVEHAPAKHHARPGAGHAQGRGHAGGAHGVAHGPILHHREKPLNQSQMMMAMGALLVIVVCIILVIVTISSQSPAHDPSSDRRRQEIEQAAIADVSSTDPAAPAPTKKPAAAAVKEAPRKRVLKPEEITQLLAQIDTANQNARREQMDMGSSYNALKSLAKARQDMGGDALPDEILAKFAELELPFKTALDKDYKALVEKLKQAKAANDEKAQVEIADDIVLRCGEDRLKTARQELEK